ncbi:hypothetical protein [Terribacillus saccharophilus]|uniref:hypothetical protein n=1 Tax=Terribacillus saccharophilus TaxID=361277 RepID=UPI002989DBFA|nr:hypothetical protein [Terribacillus saccharophilus]MCM3227541.1 hypothetical protein [Terribacillus saccharophilus]
MCQKCNDEMQYALMKVNEHKSIIIDALEVELMDDIYAGSKEGLHERINTFDSNTKLFNEDAPEKNVIGEVLVNPDFPDDIKEHIKNNFVEKLFVTYRPDKAFHEFGLISIDFEDNSKEDIIKFKAVIQTDFDVPKEDFCNAITGFVAYGNLSKFESLLNRDFVLSFHLAE